MNDGAGKTTADDDKERPNPWGLKSDEAKAAYNLLLEASRDKGKVYKLDGEECNLVAPNPPYEHPNPELTFDKPEGFVLISRNFPCLSNSQVSVNVACAQEMTAAGIQVDSMLPSFVKLNEELKRKLFKALGSKLKVLLNEKIKAEEIKSKTANAHNCVEATEVYRLYKNEAPTVGLFHKIYNAFVLPFEDPRVIDKFVYDTMYQMGIWYGSGAAYEKLNTTEKKHKVKTSQIRTIAKTVAREFRHTFTRRMEAPHGVTLCLSKEGGRKDRRKKQQFELSFIHGWGGQKHLDFCKINGYPSPPTQTLTAPAAPPTQTLKAPEALTQTGRVVYEMDTVSISNTGPPIGKSRAHVKGNVTVFGEDHLAKVTKKPPAPGRKTNQIIWLEPPQCASHRLPPIVEDIRGTKVVPIPEQEEDPRLSSKLRSPEEIGLVKMLNEISYGKKTPTRTDLEKRIAAMNEERDRLLKKNQEMEEEKRKLELAHKREQNRMKTQLQQQEKKTVEERSDAAQRSAIELARTDKKKTSMECKERQRKQKGKQQAHTTSTVIEDEDEGYEVYDIVEIHHIEARPRSKEGEFWVKVTELAGENESDKFLEGMYLHDICEEFVASGDEDRNFLFVFMEKYPEMVPVKFAQQIADKRGQKLCDLFKTCYKKFKGADAKAQGSKRSLQEALGAVGADCDEDHNASSSYKEVTEEYYFLSSRRYSKASCRICKKYFATDHNKKEKDYNKGHVPLPSQGNPCFVCYKFEANATACGNLICSRACYVKLDGSRAKRSRRPAA